MAGCCKLLTVWDLSLKGVIAQGENIKPLHETHSCDMCASYPFHDYFMFWVLRTLLVLSSFKNLVFGRQTQCKGNGIIIEFAWCRIC